MVSLEKTQPDSFAVLRLFKAFSQTHDTLHQKKLLYIQKALTISEQIKFRAGVARAYRGLGSLYFSLGDYSLSLDANYKALELADRVVGLAFTYNDMAVVYDTQNKLAKAIEYYEKGVKIFATSSAGYYKTALSINLAEAYIRANRIAEADKKPIGGFYMNENTNRIFTNHRITLSPNTAQNSTTSTTIYLCSDGYQDQFVGENGRKFMVKQLREKLFAVSKLDMASQKENLVTSFENWKGTQKQIDDVMVIGVRVNG